MDVRAKQRLSFNGFSLSLGLREGGFRPRHLNRSSDTPSSKRPEAWNKQCG
jgi:hypothetical protein